MVKRDEYFGLVLVAFRSRRFLHHFMSFLSPKEEPVEILGEHSILAELVYCKAEKFFEEGASLFMERSWDDSMR